MNARIASVVALFVISFVGAPMQSFAQTITADIGGTQVAGTSPLDISGTYPNGVTITPTSATSGAPRIEIMNDGTHDYLRMRNARITMPNPVANYQITFWVTLQMLPNANQQYDTWLNGTFIKMNGMPATGDTVKIQGWFTDTLPVPGTTTQVGTDQQRTIGGSSAVSIRTSTTPPGLGGTNNPRTLQHFLWLTSLNAGDNLNLATVNGASVKNAAATDPPDEDSKKCKEEPGGRQPDR